MSDSVFKEILQKSLESKITNDEKCKELNKKILQLEKELYPLLSKDFLNKVMEIDSLNSELFNRIIEISTDNFTIVR